MRKAVKVKNRAGCPIFCRFALQIHYAVRLQSNVSLRGKLTD